MSLVLHLHRQDSFVISSPSSCVYDTQTLAFAVSLWCWSVTFAVVVQLVPENRHPLEAADESPAKLAALQQNSEGHLQAQATQGLNDGLLQSRMRKGRWGLTQVTEGQTHDDELEEELLDELLDRRRKGQRTERTCCPTCACNQVYRGE